MLPPNPFLQLTVPRVARAVSRIEKKIWTPLESVEVSFAGSVSELIPFDKAIDFDFAPMSLPFHWGRLFDHGWFRVRFPEIVGDSVYLEWQDQGEGTLYLNGVPYYGFDVAHRRSLLPTGSSEGFIEGLCLQSAIWHERATGLDEGGSLLALARLCRRDDDAWHAWNDLLALYRLLEELNRAARPHANFTTMGPGHHEAVVRAPVVLRRLLRALDDAVNAFDVGGVPALRERLEKVFHDLRNRSEPVSAILTGHAHLDLVWLWPERCGVSKAVHTFSTMNRLLELYPEFVFGYSQPASYEAVNAHSPPLMNAVRERIQSGRWEAVGATWVESDTLLACGEALARSFAVGQKGFIDLQGHPSKVLWLPDVFGYAACLPRIMKEMGVDFFFTTKLTWSNINRFPYSSFRWRGIDGTEVLVHVTQGGGYSQSVNPWELRTGAEEYLQSDVHNEFLSPTGYGDGGGGVTEEMCERARRFRSIAGLPETKWGRVDDFFESLAKKMDSLPVWQGELYLEYHRGVLTTHGNLKAGFRACERAVQCWEAVRCVTEGGPIDEDVWKRLIFAQFHDHIPGSSIWEVYEEGLNELQSLTDSALDSATEELKSDGEECFFNPLPVSRVFSSQGHSYRIGPLEGLPVRELERCEPFTPVASPSSIRTRNLDATFDSAGRISSLRFGGEPVAVESALNELVLYPDVPHGFEAWDIDRQTLSLGEAQTSPAEVLHSSGSVEFRRKLGVRSSIAIRYSADAVLPVLHIEYDIEWKEDNVLLKALFPTRYRGRLARFGCPYGSVLRGQHPGQPRDEAMFEAAGSRWAVVSDDSEADGLGLVSESKYGFSCRDGNLGISLLRSPAVTGEGGRFERVVPAALRRGDQRPTHSDQGRHRIRIAIVRQNPETAFEQLAPALADSLFTPVMKYQGNAIRSGFLGLQGSQTLFPCWAKPAVDGRGFILRLHETHGHRGIARLVLAKEFNATRTSLNEKDEDRTITEIAYEPYDIVSIRILR